MPTAPRAVDVRLPRPAIRGVGQGPVRTHQAPARRSGRLVSSVRVPWLFGLVALLGLAGGTAWIGGRVDRGVAVPASVLDLQETATITAAQQIRTSLQAGLEDLTQLATGLAVTPAAAVDGQLKSFSSRYHRYRSVYLVDSSHALLSWTGTKPDRVNSPIAPAAPGMTDAIGVANIAVVVQYVPFVRASGGPAVAVAEYDLARLSFALNTVKPATAWVVNGHGKVVAATTGFVAFEPLSRSRLVGSAAASFDRPGVMVSQTGVDAGEIIAVAPIRAGTGSAKVPPWGLVTARSITAIVLPQTQARDQAMLLALALVVVTLATFGWLYLMWLRPLRRLVADAERIAQGDLTAPVEIRRHDEIGLVAASVERIRVGLVRDITVRRHPDHTQLLRTVRVEED